MKNFLISLFSFFVLGISLLPTGYADTEQSVTRGDIIPDIEVNFTTRPYGHLQMDYKINEGYGRLSVFIFMSSHPIDFDFVSIPKRAIIQKLTRTRNSYVFTNSMHNKEMKYIYIIPEDPKYYYLGYEIIVPRNAYFNNTQTIVPGKSVKDYLIGRIVNKI